MTIEKLASAIVAEWFDGSPGSERAQYAIEQETKRLKETLREYPSGKYVTVEVTE
jgi:hypothetical protein